MKLLILASLFVASAAQARTMALPSKCGNIKIDKVMCIVAPCPVFRSLIIRGEMGDGFQSIRLFASAPEAKAKLTQTRNGAAVCVSGFIRNTEGLLSMDVLNISSSNPIYFP